MFKFFKKKKTKENKSEQEENKIQNKNNFITLKELAIDLNTNSKQLNQIFIKLEWIEKKEAWVTATEKGLKAGAKEQYNRKTKQKYVIWNENIKLNLELKEQIKHLKENNKEKQEEKPKRMTNKEKKEKGDVYEKYICDFFLEKGYRVIEHGKEKGLKDCGIDLIIKKDRYVLFVQCKNWEQKHKSRLTNKDIQYIRMNVRDFLDKKEIFKYYNWKISFIASQDILGASGKHVINEFKDEVEYLVIPIKD